MKYMVFELNFKDFLRFEFVREYLGKKSMVKLQRLKFSMNGFQKKE